MNDDIQGPGLPIETLAGALGIPPRTLLEHLSSLEEDRRAETIESILSIPSNQQEIQRALDNGETPPPLTFDVESPVFRALRGELLDEQLWERI